MAEEESADEMIPKSVMLKRINAKNSHIEKLEAEKGKLADKLAAAQAFESEAKTADDLRSQLEALAGEFETYKTDTGTRESLYARGILNSADQELVLWKYNKLEEAPPLSDWLEAGAKEDKHLSGIFKSDAPAPAEVAPPAVRPSGNNGTAQPPAAGQTLTWEVIQQMPADERKKRNSEIMAALGYK
jgi:hypothetical protein